MTLPFVFNSVHKGLSCDKCEKKFCYHNILVNFHFGSTPSLPSPPHIVTGGGAETMYNQITFIFSKE